MGLPILMDWKRYNYDSILVLINWLTKMIYYKPVKITINAPGLAKVIIDVTVRYYGLPDSIVTNWGSFFISKFWLLLCYFSSTKWRLSIAFHPQINGQIKRQNNTIELYFQAFVNFK